MKICKLCNASKELSEFYIIKGNKDGLSGSCKDCTKKRISKHRKNNIERIRAYDRQRGCRQEESYRKEIRKNKPKQYVAQTAVNNAIRAGKLKRKPCEVCGCGNSHAHHDDYSKPLKVRFLCAMHHKQWHEKHGEGLNAI